jgi:hypothetical protein
MILQFANLNKKVIEVFLKAILESTAQSPMLMMDGLLEALLKMKSLLMASLTGSLIPR